jgi:hypothetical protein
MQKSISKTPVVNNTLESEGKALATIWKGIVKGNFDNATKADGFDTRLGKLMLALKAEGGQRISTDRLKDCGINGIDKRRRSEALWFVENEKACRDFVAKSKKGFTSLTALQAAMKPKAAPKPKADTETPTGSEADDKSKVGLDSEAEQSQELSAEGIALDLMLQIEAFALQAKCSNEQAFKLTMAAIKAQADMLDQDLKAAA